MRVLLSTYGSRGDVEPMVGLAAQSRALGVEMPMCASPAFVEPLARVGVALVPVGQQVRPLMTGATPPSAADLPWRTAELVRAAAEGCDALVATGVMAAGVWR